MTRRAEPVLLWAEEMGMIYLSFSIRHYGSVFG